MGRSSAGAAVGVEEAGQVSGAWRSALRKVLKGMRTSQIGRYQTLAIKSPSNEAIEKSS